ncbi:hypothetical protein [Pyruvatibacter sp.]|uniref:hypothetical protein n=1 Tax=Pyruvatibacter sp. TaxID=1981328 RepID=UPI0032EB9192
MAFQQPVIPASGFNSKPAREEQQAKIVGEDSVSGGMFAKTKKAFARNQVRGSNLKYSKREKGFRCAS